MPPSVKIKDVNPLLPPSKRMAKGKKKPARKTAAMGTPRRKAAAKKKPAKKTRK